jgi:PIN domain nuclease of toxin-antitoxin system
MKVLLDTCTIIYIAIEKNLASAARQVVQHAANADTLFVSLASAWELGMLVSRSRLPTAFFEEFLNETGAHTIELDMPLLISSSYLPGRVHGDPWDRMLIETARRHKLTLLTSDREILRYGSLGHVQTLAC